MDIAAIVELRARALEMMAAAEKYRALAQGQGFYHALAFTYERAAREMQIMLDSVARAQTSLRHAA